MAYLNSKGAARLQDQNVLAGILLVQVHPTKLIEREGDVYRKFKLVNHKKVMYVDLQLDEYSHVHPADISPFYLDEVTPIEFGILHFAQRGVQYKVEFCQDNRRCFFRVLMANGAKPETYSYPINFIISEKMDDAIQNLRMTFTSIPQIAGELQ